MADNFTAGGILFASDDIGAGLQAVRLKLGWGADGSYGDITAANPLPVEEKGPALTALQLIDDMIASLGSAVPTKASLVAGTDGTNARALRVTDSNGRLSVDINTLPAVALTGAIPAGANAIGSVTANLAAGSNNIGRVTLQDAGGDLANITAGGLLETNCNQAGTWVVNEAPRASGGLTAYRRISTNTTNAVNVKATPGQIYTIVASNLNAAARYLKLYNLSGAPNLASDTPVMTIPIPAGSTAGSLVQINFPGGLAFSTGIAIAITAAIGDTDTTAVAANEIVVNLGYN